LVILIIVIFSVSAFLDQRFPTIIALNKIDLPDSDQNIYNICKKYDEVILILGMIKSKLVPISALSEIFLKKLQKQGFINYVEGTDNIEIFEDQSDDVVDKLKPLDDKSRQRLDKVKDLVLFRYWSTGVQECLKKAVEVLDIIPVFPVRNIHNFTTASAGRSSGVFRDCLLVKKGTTVRQFAGMVHPEIDRFYHYAETVGGIRLGEETVITLENNIISFKTSQEYSK
jgi:ribosome-binding ATPase YchF (GTP1/OBG family)